ncbi:MAG: hypothetical protein SFX18_16125 [Pirellulales bacterium]|nr:hypothetical protein [Pirellulales bacterium]
MRITLSVNEALDQKQKLAGLYVSITGLLHFEFEDVAIYHSPASQLRTDYDSSIWLEVGQGNLRFNPSAYEAMHGKLVVAKGTLLLPDPHIGGCGHMSLWPALLVIRTLERAC